MLHHIVATIRTLLDDHAVPYTYLEHEPGRTSKEMAEIRKDFSLAEGAKALVLAADTQYIQVVLPRNARFSDTKLGLVVGANDIRFVTEQELERITDGIRPGAIPPFGNLFQTPLPVYADTTVFTNERMVFNCGERTASITMNPQDYKKVVQPIVVDIV